MNRTGPSLDSAALEDAIFQTAEPLIRRVVRWRLGSTASPQDQEDVVGDIVLELLARIKQSEPISDLAAYTAVASNHGCDRYLRRRFPQRHRLATRVRYLLETSRDFAIWEGEGGALVCALSRHRGQAAKSALPSGWTRQVPLPARSSEPDAVRAVFNHIGGALRLQDLVDAIALLLNVRDETVPAEQAWIASSETDPGLRLDQRRILERLWSEIALLPRPQRVALLLNLRDDDGACALTALPATGVASMREIARVIEMEAEDLAGIWRALPLNDLEIAARLGISRQQVINLRKAARQRLTRRMSGNNEPEPPSKKAIADFV